jgi:starch synthase
MAQDPSAQASVQTDDAPADTAPVETEQVAGTDDAVEAAQAVEIDAPVETSLPVEIDQSVETDEASQVVEVEETRKLRVLFVASECAPYAKTGGLGDVVAALPKALRRLGHDVRIVMPLYGSIDRAKFGLTPEGTSCVHMGMGVENWVGTQTAMLDGEVPVWFVDYERFFGRPGVYDYAGKEYPDNAFRFALLSKAALQICKDRHFIPDIVHAHDWPTALVPVFLNTWDKFLSPLSSTATVLTIHNIGYQGLYHRSAYAYIGVGDEHFNLDVFEYYGQLNLLKAGIHFADALTTVSPTHAREILGAAGGMGLSYYLQRRSGALFGILNGVDYEHWNPATDQLIPARYTPDDLSGKAVCKAALQKRFGLEQNADLPLFGIVSRFAPQKGFNLLREALPNVLRDMLMQVVVLGTGDAETEGFFHWLTYRNPGRVGSYIGFSNELSHLIEAGSDFFLMPSLYEPCGLNQSYSMKYATLPVVRATGGLDDTVQNYDEATVSGTGFKFWDASERALYYTIGWAVSTWFDRPQHISQLRQQAMAQDFSWRDSAQKYAEVYEHALGHKRVTNA